MSQEALRDSLKELCQEMGDIAYYQIEDFSPGLYRLEVRDICKFGSEEEDMSDEEWQEWQSEEDEPDPGPPRYVGVDSAAIVLADISHLRQLTRVLNSEQYDNAMRDDSVFPETNKALGGPYYALLMPGPGTEFDGDGTYTIRKGAIKRVKE